MIPDRYSPEVLSFALRNPSIFIGEFRRVLLKINQFYYRKMADNDGCFVRQEDWDNLIILDACRADTYREYALKGGNLETRKSRASESSTFLMENFAGQDLTDTVYVTANPYVSKIRPGTFHDVVNLIKNEWSEEHRTVLPEKVAEQLLKARYRYPNKRIIAHFMQPHYPFIGELGQEIAHAGIAPDNDQEVEPRHIWRRLQYGIEEIEPVRRAYRENLLLVLDVVEDLLGELEGRTIVTADHGNLLGERTGPIPVRWFGHPKYLRVPELVTVPWHIFDAPEDERPEITAEPSIEGETVSSDVVEDRLKHLGYW